MYKRQDKTFEYKGKQNIARPQGQYKVNDGAPIRAMQTVEIARTDTIEQDSDTPSNKELTVRVAEIGEKVHTVDTKINERLKVFETTMQKSFIEQVTRMEGRFKEHISRCEKQTQDVAKKVDSLEVRIQTDATETQRQVNRLDASIVETRSNICLLYTSRCV